MKKEPASPARMRRAAMDLLARREHSRKELLFKLSRKFSAGSVSLEHEQAQGRGHELVPKQAQRQKTEPELELEPRSGSEPGSTPGSTLGSTLGIVPALEIELDKLQREGLQSDQRTAENFIRSRIAKGQGPVRIRSELRTRGIDDSIIQASLANLEINWFDLADSLVLKRYGNVPPKDVKEKAKRLRFLQQRGFSFEHYRIS